VLELKLDVVLDEEADEDVVPETTGLAVIAAVVAISVSVKP